MTDVPNSQMVHIVYEASAALGSFLCPLMIQAVGINYACLLTPICLAFSSFIWYCISALGEAGKIPPKSDAPTVPYNRNFFVKIILAFGKALCEIGSAILLFFKCFFYGSWLLFTHRKLVWLLLYAISLAAHLYLSTGVFPLWSTSVLGEPAWTPILEGGYLVGKLVAGVLVLALSTVIRTPLPWMRIDALTLNLVWLFAYLPAEPHVVLWAWRMAAVCIPISISVAASDISLMAHLQATLPNMPNLKREMSPLPAVLSVVSICHLASFVLLSMLLGRYTDGQLKELTGPELIATAKEVLKYVGGVLCSGLCVLILAISFIPKGSFAWNPTLIDDGEADDSRGHTTNAVTDETHHQTPDPDLSADLSESEMQEWIRAVHEMDDDGASVINVEGSAPRLKFRKSLGAPPQIGDGRPLSDYFEKFKGAQPGFRAGPSTNGA